MLNKSNIYIVFFLGIFSITSPAFFLSGKTGISLKEETHLIMEKIEIKKNIYLYYFKEYNKKTSGNILVLINETEALIIDTSYKRHMIRVIEDLSETNTIIDTIILSHRHEDHIDGVKAFKKPFIIAGKDYIDDHQNHLKEDIFLNSLRPDRYVKDMESITFGQFNLKFIKTIGHAESGITTVINNKIIHVGDMVIFDVTNKLSLPYIDENSSSKKMIEGLKRIKNLNAEIVIPAHGKPIYGKAKINNILNSYLEYIHKLQTSGGKIPLEECLPKNMTDCSFKNFHEYNSKRI